MNIIKLSAIDSTNSYLKKLANKSHIESYTVVVSKYQSAGRGQMGTLWVSDKGKNLTFSVLINFSNLQIEQQFYLSMAISLGVSDAVKICVKKQCMVKWPNDIMAEKDKLAGILIENQLNGNFVSKSVVGIGVNVNQINFPDAIKNVTSLRKISGVNYDIDKLLKSIVMSIKKYINFIENKNFKNLKKLYINSLYKYRKPTMFEGKDGRVFLGKIVDVCEDGRLVVELENETTCKFSLKEIKFASR